MANLVSFEIKRKIDRGIQKIYSMGGNLDFLDILMGGSQEIVVVEFFGGGIIEIYKDHKTFTYRDDNKISYYDSLDGMLDHLPEDIKETIIFNLDIFRGL